MATKTFNNQRLIRTPWNRCWRTNRVSSAVFRDLEMSRATSTLEVRALRIVRNASTFPVRSLAKERESDHLTATIGTSRIRVTQSQNSRYGTNRMPAKFFQIFKVCYGSPNFETGLRQNENVEDFTKKIQRDTTESETIAPRKTGSVRMTL